MLLHAGAGRCRVHPPPDDRRCGRPRRSGVRQGPPPRCDRPAGSVTLRVMAAQHTDGGSDLGRFLRARREQISPQQVGLTPGPGLRRTPGLRREELATLAGVSVDYYTRLERGRETRPSPPVVDALARALRLEQAEHDHLVDLALRAARTAPERPSAPSRTVSHGVHRILDKLRPFAAHVVGRSHDVLAANPAGLRT